METEVLDKKKTLVPKLRFKGFDGSWTKSQFDDVANKKVKWSITGGPFGSNLKSSDYTESGVRILQLQNLGDGVFLDDYKIYTSKEKADELISCNIYPNDIILSKMGDPVARACFIPDSEERFLMASDGIRLVVDEERFSKYYIYSYINHPFFRNIAISNSTGSTRKRIGLSELRIIPINHPTLPEQQKIASFLSAVDEKIQQLTRKKELLEQYKKGVMQQLFPSTGSGQRSGKLRFKDENGKAFPKWEEKLLGDIFHCAKGNGLSKDKLELDGKYECILYGQLYTTYKEVVSCVASKTNCKEGELSKIGDLLVPCSTTTTGIDLANVTALNIENVLLGGDITVLRTKEKVDNIFYAYYLSNYKKHKIASYAQGSTIVHLSYNNLKLMKIDLPCFEEQNLIANLLINIDNKIESVTKQITQTQTFKKGLLQQMFV